MQQLIESGRIADIILALIALEIVCFALLRRLAWRAPKLVDLLGTLLSGLFLIAALRSGLAGADWTVTASFLMAALLSHLFDLWRRWPSS
ncbi:MAG: hypothetical protein AAGD43_00215 [Pseudomonadota bacterium]